MKLNHIVFGILVAASAGALADTKVPVVEMGRSSLSLEDRVSKLEDMIQARGKAQINIQQQFDDLQNDVNQLRGVTELHSHKLEEILARQRDLYQELDKRVSSALSSNTSVNKPNPVTTDALLEQNITYSANLSENEAYERAVNLVLKDRRYDAAIPEFQAFNKQYPDSTYAANSHYWLGQLLFYKADFKEAEREFLFVVDNYTDSSKRPDALLKLGMVAQKQNQNAKAKQIYQRLIKDYPDSSAAKLATARIPSL